MEEKIVRVRHGDQTLTRVGIPVCTGPASYRMMVTWPERQEGRIVEIPKDEIESIDDAEPRLRGETPDAAPDVDG